MSFNSIPQTEGTDDLLGVYLIGTVVVNDDPKRMERIKVSIPKLYSGDQANLPWVAPCKAGKFRNKTTSGEFGLVPEVGDEVIIVFQQGKVLYPMYVGYPYKVNARPGEFLTNYLKRYGWKDPEGNVLFFDTTAGANPKFSFTHVAGVTVTISNTGEVAVTTNNLIANVNGNLTATVTGNASANVNGNLSATIGGTGSISSGGNMNISSGGKLTLGGATGVQFTGPRVDF